MDLFSKEKFYVWVIGILIVLNLATLVFLWIGRPHKLPPPPQENVNARMGEFLNRELNLRLEQVQKFNEYREEHFDTTSSISRAINERKKAIIDEIFRDHPDKEKVKKLAAEIGGLNTQLEEFLFDHFIKLKSVLNKDQAARFENLIHESMRSRPQELPLPPGSREALPPARN